MSWISRILRRTDNDSQNHDPSEQHRVALQRDSSGVSVTGDNPIRMPEDDALGRAKVARSFAAQVLSLDVSEGVVVGVLGPWGSGKTSFVNLARVHLEEAGISILDFNPWMFSGAEQLVEAFFVEIRHSSIFALGLLRSARR